MSLLNPEAARALSAFRWLSSLRAEIQIDPPETMSGDGRGIWRLWQAYEPGDLREVTGSGKTLLAAVEGAVEAETRRRAVVRPHEIVDALHARTPRPLYRWLIAVDWKKQSSRKWARLSLVFQAHDKEGAKAEVAEFAKDMSARYDIRRVTRGGLVKKARR